MADLSTQVVEVVGAKTAALLESEFEIVLVEDLLRHYPRRYEQRGALTDLGNLEIGDHVTVQAQVKSFKNLKNAKGGTRQEVVISDGSGSLTLMFFNQHWREKDLVAGRQGLFAGQVSVFNNKRQLTHPEYELLDDAADVNPDDYAEAFLPVYPATKKLQTWTIERSIDLALTALGEIEDPLPAEIRKTEGLIDLAVAMREIHKPTSLEQLEASRLRLKWDEALALQVVLAKQRHEEESWPAIARSENPDGLLAAFDAKLPFTLTQGQVEVAKTISA
jgi:ATP-dependent DNA helicase RecG